MDYCYSRLLIDRYLLPRYLFRYKQVSRRGESDTKWFVFCRIGNTPFPLSFANAGDFLTSVYCVFAVTVLFISVEQLLHSPTVECMRKRWHDRGLLRYGIVPI